MSKHWSVSREPAESVNSSEYLDFIANSNAESLELPEFCRNSCFESLSFWQFFRNWKIIFGGEYRVIEEKGYDSRTLEKKKTAWLEVLDKFNVEIPSTPKRAVEQLR